VTDPAPGSIRYSADDVPSRTLAAADPAMAELIARLGSVELNPGTVSDRFTSLVRGIVGQQLSGRAAEHIFERLRDHVGLTPEHLASASDEELLGVGLSRRKAEYVRGLACAVLSGDLDVDAFDGLSDDDILAQLVAIRGVGPWTAHMFLLFAMRRPDVIAPGDLGIRQAVGRLLKLGRTATPTEVLEAAERWRPYRSAATFYLYRDSWAGPPPAEPEERDRAAAE
jgi:DNA-3-methyladenine glycosylase II